MADLQLLETLCACNGISGSEGSVRELILREITPHVTDVQIDPLGSIIAFKKGKNRAKTDLMLSAHMDEVGLIVTYITEDGKLKFAPVGGIDKRILPGKKVLVGDVPGVIGAKPIHLLKPEEKSAAVPLDALCIDIGAENREEAESVVSLGDPVTFDSLIDFSGSTVKAKAIDDRAGCAILIDLIKTPLEYDMTFVFCVQEEVGLRGARAAAYSVDPQAAIVVESTTAADIPGVTPEKDYYQLALALAKAEAIPCQIKQAVAGGNDAGAIHTTKSGVRTIAVSLPCRYLHGPVGLIAQSDYHHAEALILSLANKIAGSSEP